MNVNTKARGTEEETNCKLHSNLLAAEASWGTYFRPKINFNFSARWECLFCILLASYQQLMLFQLCAIHKQMLTTS